MSFKLTILGCSSAIPNINRHPSSQLLNSNENLFLIDCGEGTQLRIRENKLSFHRISHILISHLHGDHFFGLIGLISSMHLLGRKKELHIYSHIELKDIINTQLKVTNTVLNYPIFFHEIPKESEEVIFENDLIKIKNLLLDHRIPCSGFLFEEKKHKRIIDKDAINKYKIPEFQFNNIRSGEDFEISNGKFIQNKLITKKGKIANSYAYCSDTRFKESLVKKIEGVDLLYHEATFIEKHKEIAFNTGHSTALQAAQLASISKVNNLLLGHFSQRYTDYNLIKKEAQTIFKNVILARNGLHINFRDLIHKN